MGEVRQVFLAPVWARYAAKLRGATCVTLVPEHTARHSHLMMLTGHEGHEDPAATGVLTEFTANRLRFP